MSFTLYDKAMTEKIKKWVLDPQMVVLSPDETRETFQWKADINRDRPLQLPLITLNRDREATLIDVGKKALSYQGKVFNSLKGMSDHLNAVRVNLSYTLNIYTRTLEQADEYVRQFVFNIINYSDILIKIPYNDSQLAYRSFITLGDTVADNSDIPERLLPGQFSRMTLSLLLNDAYLFSYNRRMIPHITGIDINNQTPGQPRPPQTGEEGSGDDNTTSNGSSTEGTMPCDWDDFQIEITL